MDDSNSLRKILLDEISSLRAGTTDPQRAKAVAALANQLLKSVEVEMTFREQLKRDASLAELGHMPLTLPLVNNVENPVLTGAKPEPRAIKGRAY